MSLVGTRPPTVDEWDKYELHHRARLATKPGLTGMWQVSGRSNITDLRNSYANLKKARNKQKRIIDAQEEKIDQLEEENKRLLDLIKSIDIKKES